MVVATAVAAAGEFVVGVVVAGFGVDDQIAASEGIKNDVDKAGTSDDGAFWSQSLLLNGNVIRALTGTTEVSQGRSAAVG